MNEQEMQFADPDWQPRTLRPTPQESRADAPLPGLMDSNPSYAASQDSSAPAYGQGYRGSYQGRSPFTTPAAQQVSGQRVGRSRRSGSLWWIWLIVIVLLFSMIGGMSHSFKHNSVPWGPSAQPPIQQNSLYTYKLNDIGQLALSDPSGSVSVRVGDGETGAIAVETDGSQPYESFTSGSLTLNLNDSGSVLVIVPRDAALSLNIDAGNIEVDGFSGQLSARTDTGTITLNNDTLNGDSTIISNAGDISLNGDALSGQVTIKATGNGGITFGGTLAPQGKYQFVTDSGDITLNLPPDTSMQVQSLPGTGNYQSDFPPSTGNGPKASVTVESNSGDITIHNSYSQ